MKRKYTIRILCILIIISALVILIKAIHKPSLSQYEEDFDFSLENIKVEILDYYRHTAFRDSFSIYDVKVIGDINDTVFDTSKMVQGIPESTEAVLKEAIELTKNNSGWRGLNSINSKYCKSLEIYDVNSGTDACLYIINSGRPDKFIVIWVG